MPSTTHLFRLLADSPAGNVFNPWRDVDPDHDATPLAPKWRRENLKAYLDARLTRVRWVLVAEAVGFRGGKFSGVAMTCERLLPQSDVPHKRTSNIDIPLSRADREQGVLEPTATIVARTLAGASVDPHDVILWNTFAWHPHKPGDRLTNRTPTPAELSHGLPVLREMLELVAGKRVIAIGKTCLRTMHDTLGLDVPCVRHPANGGATAFSTGVRAIVSAI
jgi:hypothetical protein